MNLKISLEAGEFADSTALRLIRQGIEQGIERGIEQGIEQARYNHISKMLLKKMDIAWIAEVLEVPVKKVKTIHAKLRKEGKLT